MDQTYLFTWVYCYLQAKGKLGESLEVFRQYLTLGVNESYLVIIVMYFSSSVIWTVQGTQSSRHCLYKVKRPFAV